MTQEQRRGLDDLHMQLLGRLGDVSDAADETLVEGIPRPAWFKPQLPTYSEATGAGLALRRTT
jgi:hypothetical protein